MKQGKVRRILLLTSVLLLSACSSKVQPKAIELSTEVQEQNQTLSVTPLPSEILTNESIEEPTFAHITETPVEKWTPLKIEDEIEWNAKELLGRKYVWGATGPINYDCSGFTQKIYDDLGIKLPRISREQAKEGELVSFEELKKGDLVFFQTNKRKPGKVTHVGIYLGKGDFIHASSGAKKIVICNFEKDCFYKKRFLWARRVIKPKQHIASSNNLNHNETKSL